MNESSKLFAFRIYAALANARGRYPQIMGLRTPKMPPRHRASAVDICDRMVRRGWRYKLSDVEVELKNLQAAGIVDRAEGGYAIIDVDALDAIAREVDPKVKRVCLERGQNNRVRTVV